jgi:hypothetical protein
MPKVAVNSLRTTFVLLACFGLTACGGGSSGDRTQSLSGTAAVGAAMSGATITLKDVNGITQAVTAAADGTYTFSDIESLSAPLMLKAEGMVDGVPAELYSALDSKPEDLAVVTNVTPITNAIVTQLALGDPATVFSSRSEIASKITTSALSDAIVKVQNVLADFNGQLGVSRSFDPIKTSFSADSTGMDKLLDLVRFEADVSGTMIITDKANGVVKFIQKGVSAGSITKLAAPSSSLVNLDFTKVKTLVSAMNQISTGTVAWSELLDSGFLHGGLDAATFASNRRNEGSDFTVQSYQFDGCNASTSVCDGNFNLKYKDGYTLPLYMPLKYVNGAWKMYGDQRAYAMRFAQMVDVQIQTALTKPTDQDIRFGFDLFVKSQPFNAQEVQTPGANIFFSTDGKQSWSPVIWELVPLTDCDHLVLKGASACDSFIPLNTLSSSMLTDMQQAFLEGKFWLRIDPKTAPSPARAEFRPRLRMYSDADQAKIRTKLTASFDASARGKNEIPVIPNAEFVRVIIANASNTDIFSAEFDVTSKTLQSLGSSITVAEACAPSDASPQIKILVNSARSTLCANPASAQIKSVFQSIPNPAYSGERIRLRY